MNTMNRLEIFHSTGKVINISPEKEKEFIRLLVTENPDIVVNASN
ncbi:PH domain-containing protein [Halobacillus salinus]|nr:PH domain-containing protein [Halobacillus salinus]